MYFIGWDIFKINILFEIFFKMYFIGWDIFKINILFEIFLKCILSGGRRWRILLLPDWQDYHNLFLVWYYFNVCFIMVICSEFDTTCYVSLWRYQFESEATNIKRIANTLQSNSSLQGQGYIYNRQKATELSIFNSQGHNVLPSHYRLLMSDFWNMKTETAFIFSFLGCESSCSYEK